MIKMKANTIYAKTKYVKSTPRKTRLVLDLVRGKKALEALEILEFTNKGAALDVAKVVKSAMSNAVNNESWDKKKIIISEAFVDEAPTFKRGLAVSRGRYHQILKRNCHITVGVQQIN